MKTRTVAALLSTFFLCLLAQGVALADEKPDNVGTGLETKAEPLAGAEASLMDKPLDTSSSEALKASMAELKAEVSKKEYQQLTWAIGKFRTYDLAVRSNPDVLLSRIQDMSPNEVIELAGKNWP